jgi:hypothetical protein
MTTGVIAAFAEFERDLLIERTQSGLTRTKSKGKTLGNLRGLDVQTTNWVALRFAQDEDVAALAREFGVRRRSNMRIGQASIAGLEYHVHRNGFSPHVTRTVSKSIAVVVPVSPRISLDEPDRSVGSVGRCDLKRLRR